MMAAAAAGNVAHGERDEAHHEWGGSVRCAATARTKRRPVSHGRRHGAHRGKTMRKRLQSSNMQQERQCQLQTILDADAVGCWVWVVSGASVQMPERRGDVEQPGRNSCYDVVVHLPEASWGGQGDGGREEDDDVAHGERDEACHEFCGSDRCAATARTNRHPCVFIAAKRWGKADQARGSNGGDVNRRRSGMPTRLGVGLGVGRGRPYNFRSAVVMSNRPEGIAVIKLLPMYLHVSGVANGKG